MAAEVLAQGGASITVYDQMASPGRKFLLAGRGGLNLTHSEDFQVFLSRYKDAAPNLQKALEAFPPEKLRAWCEELGQETFVGTSGRVFPKAMKTSPLLRAWLKRLQNLGVSFIPRHRWLGWSDQGSLTFATPQGEVAIAPDAAILALGGASWPQLGSDGHWAGALAMRGIEVAPMRPSNCGFLVDWSEHFKTRFEGQPLKGIELWSGEASTRGEAMITRHGIEGGGIYALSSNLRERIDATGEVLLKINLRPEMSVEELETKLAKRTPKQSLSTFLRKALHLPPVAIGLLHEEGLIDQTPQHLAQKINGLTFRLKAPMPIARAISTAGGVTFGQIDANYMLRRKPGTFVAGEMLDWEAPTGGYLLQACFSTGRAAALGALDWLKRSESSS